MSNTFTAPGNGADTFAAYTFDPDFASPLFTHVDILAPRWAMDNLVFVIPEPGAAGLVVLGLLAGFVSRRQRTGRLQESVRRDAAGQPAHSGFTPATRRPAAWLGVAAR